MEDKMKRFVLPMLLTGVLLSLCVSPACSTTEEQAIVYDITGNWQFTVNLGLGPGYNLTMIFSGSPTTGVANNITEGTTGIYTVTNTQVEILLNYYDAMCWDVTENYPGSFTSPTTMSGSLHFSSSGPCMWISGATWTAIKL
jgi:hypothetical protein